jgi:hypothetical protein
VHYSRDTTYRASARSDSHHHQTCEPGLTSPLFKKIWTLSQGWNCLVPRASMPRTVHQTRFASCAPAPHAAHQARLMLRSPPVSRATRALCLMSHAARVSHAPASTFIGWQQIDEHMLQPYVSCVLHMFLYIAMAIHVCYKCICFKSFSSFKRTSQVFHLDVAYVPVTIHLCCNCVFEMYQLFHLDIVYFF